VKQLVAAASERFAIFHLRNRSPAHQGDQIYVHSKLMIVDDIWAQVGSMNCNRRSLTHDTEAAVAVLDEVVEGEACKFARDLRLILWAEHLSLDPNHTSLLDPLEGFAIWRARAGLPDVPAVEHTRATSRSAVSLNFLWYPINRLAWDLIDPSGLGPEEADAGT
jgi:phosphatidylserine/phosphatidylglycerophosphate/cardiolipin synthase-like enzyme